MKDFAAFILTHGRANQQRTLRQLLTRGYTGPIYLVVDDQDKQLSAYQAMYPGQVIVFSKDDYAGKFDIGDNSPSRHSVIYARNALWDIARELGVRYYIALDDDYRRFSYRFDKDFMYRNRPIWNLDAVFAAMVEFLEAAPQFGSISMAQGGDFIGGPNGLMGMSIWMKRKAMNTFVCATDRPFEWVGRMNDDVNTYTVNQRSGLAFGTINFLSIEQPRTQEMSGGLTEMYLEAGTYVKSFYTVMMVPSATKVATMGLVERRLHHLINWDAVAPKIIPESLRRE